MDEKTVKMVAEAYDETMAEAIGQGRPAATAHTEALTAAAMFLSAITGIDDSVARAQVDSIGLSYQQ